jgi:hypothetical protein
MGLTMPHLRTSLHLAAVTLLMTLLSAQEEPRPAARPATIDEVGVTLVRDEFAGSGSVLAGAPAEDLDGGGWLTTDPAIQPGRAEGLLRSGGAGGVAAIRLPPLSPQGEVTISTGVVLRDGPAVLFGFTDALRHPSAGAAGPLVRIAGDGRVTVLQDPATSLGEARIPRGSSPTTPLPVVMRYRLWDKSVSVSAGGKDLVRAVLTAAPAVPHRVFTIAFAAPDVASGPALDALHINYVPLERPQTPVPHRTVVVQDTSLEGITKALTDANAESGPENLIEVSIPTGDYHFTPSPQTKEHLFRLFGLRHLIINWNASTITIHDPAMGLHNLSAGRNVTVRNIASVDFPQDRLPFTQGTVRVLDQKAGSFDLEIDEGYPSPTNDFFTRSRRGESWGQLIDPATPGLRPRGAAMEYWINQVEPVTGRTFRYQMKGPLHGFQVGSRFVDCPRAGNALFRIFDAKNVRLENITGHSSPHFWSMVYNSTVSYHRVRVVLKPGRLMTANGDLVTGTGNRLWMDHCEFEGNADDICHQFRGEATYIANSLFRNNRRFGVWFNTGEFGVVTNCLFDGIGSFAITGMKEPDMQEDIRFATRTVLCVGNRFRNLGTDAIVTHSTHTREDPSPHWNTYWRLVRNDSTAPFRIGNATDVRCVANSNGAGGIATIKVDAAKTADVVIDDTLTRKTFTSEQLSK